jgi:O-antigen/teichoic acid export membrane protein
MSDITSQERISTPSPSAALEQTVLTTAKGGGIMFAGTVFAHVVRLVLGIVLARFLGSEQYGLYSLSLTAVILASNLALLGLSSALVRYVSLFASRRDAEGLWGALQIGIGFPTALSVLFGIGLYVGASPIAERLFHEPRLVHLLRLVSLVVPFLSLNDTIAAATRGFKKMQYTVIAQNISQPAIKLILILIVVLATGGLNAAKVLYVQIVVIVIVSVILLYSLNNLFPLRRSLKTARRETREMLGFALPLHLDYLIHTFQDNVQTVLLGALNTITTVGIFDVAVQVNLIGKTFQWSIVKASMPIVSELYSRGEQEQMARIYRIMTKWTFTLNLPLFLVMLLFSEPILSIFGRDFVGGALALIILACGDLVKTGVGIAGVIINMTGNTVFNLVNSIIVSVLALALNVLLIPRWGVVGAATAILAAAITVSLLRLLEVFLLFRLLPYNASFVKPVAAGLVTLVTSWVIRQAFHTEANLFYTAMNVTILFAVYVGMILLLGLSQEERRVLARIGRRVSAGLLK